MQRADVALYDHLVSTAVLDLLPASTRAHLRRQGARHHTLPQEEINDLLVRLAREGKRVVRLKGGDPFIFGRGGEEIDTLAAQGVPFEVVPGITAALGVAVVRRHSADAPRLRAGVPVRHRPPEGRQHGPRLARAGASAADGRRLHGPPRPARPCAELIAHGASGRTAGGGRPAGHDARAARGDRNARNAAGARRRGACCSRRR